MPTPPPVSSRAEAADLLHRWLKVRGQPGAQALRFALQDLRVPCLDCGEPTGTKALRPRDYCGSCSRYRAWAQKRHHTVHEGLSRQERLAQALRAMAGGASLTKAAREARIRADYVRESLRGTRREEGGAHAL